MAVNRTTIIIRSSKTPPWTPSASVLLRISTPSRSLLQHVPVSISSARSPMIPISKSSTRLSLKSERQVSSFKLASTAGLIRTIAGFAMPSLRVKLAPLRSCTSSAVTLHPLRLSMSRTLVASGWTVLSMIWTCRASLSALRSRRSTSWVLSTSIPPLSSTVMSTPASSPSVFQTVSSARSTTLARPCTAMISVARSLGQVVPSTSTTITKTQLSSPIHLL
ncbi:unnamed protein product [Chondrus crispus]|uniref:Uncharacterized protein n=1 Tax=Chondrus crispus TaxID=2769 RepID=R7Q642_CHOCR|nr:unnamed protein product [Chondrus crispus]CDF33323.1 unnamed protein product [Chondrus crispus]|eukprot:XP_005713126.1 unnamed protein product [Chondrus crispus]